MKQQKLLAFNSVLFVIFVLFLSYELIFLMGIIGNDSISVPLLPSDPGYSPYSQTYRVIHEGEPVFPFFEKVLYSSSLRPINGLMENNPFILIGFYISLPFLYLINLGLAAYNLRITHSKKVRLFSISIMTFLITLLVLPFFITQLGKFA